MRYVNLTPHNIVLVPAADSGETTRVILPPSGSVARVRWTRAPVCFALGGLVVGRLTDIRPDPSAPIEGLPDPAPETVYIVSLPTLLALAAAGARRPDVWAPDTETALRDAGRVIGVTGFLRLA